MISAEIPVTLKGINAASDCGIVAGDPDKKFAEVIAQVSSGAVIQIRLIYERRLPMEIEHLAGGSTFDIL